MEGTGMKLRMVVLCGDVNGEQQLLSHLFSDDQILVFNSYHSESAINYIQQNLKHNGLILTC